MTASIDFTNRVSAIMSSREIAEETGKRHSDVLEAIRSMESAWIKVTGRNFPLSEYTDSTGRKLPQYELNKKECLYIATKFNDEARARLIIRWEQLENQHRIPQTLSEALMLAAQQAQEIEKQKDLIDELAPKALFADAVATSDKSILINELAKILVQNGYETGEKRLFECLRSNGFLCSKGDMHNLPTQRASEMGLFEIKKTTITKPDGTVLVSNTTKVTPKGQLYFVKKFLSMAEAKEAAN